MAKTKTDTEVALNPLATGGFYLCWYTENPHNQKHNMRHELHIVDPEEMIDIAGAFGFEYDKKHKMCIKLAEDAAQWLSDTVSDADAQESYANVRARELPEPYRTTVLKTLH